VRIWDMRKLGTELNLLRGHQDSVYCLYYYDGKLISGGEDKTAQVFRSSNGKHLLTYKDHTSVVNQIVFSPDANLVASVSWDKTIRIWEIATGKSIAVLTGHQLLVRTILWGKNNLLYTGGDDKVIRIWGMETEGDFTKWKELSTLSGHKAFVMFLAFSPDQQRIASASSDNTIKVWDLKESKEIATLAEHKGMVWAVAFSPDGKFLASASGDKTLRIWDLTTNKQISVLSGHTSIIFSVNFSLDGKCIVSSAADYSVKLWNISDVMASSGKQKGVLLWSTSHSLTLEEALINNVHGLSPENHALLMQRGAIEKVGKENKDKGGSSSSSSSSSSSASSSSASSSSTSSTASS